MKTKILVMVVAVVFLYSGINCSKESKAPAPGSSIQLKGKLVKGSVPLSTQGVLGKITPLQEPLENYKLYCVTFEDNPKAASGTADNTGSFSLAIDGAGIPFGCFVLDSNGKHVADLIFAQGISSGAPTSGSILLTDSADLGTITVDLDKGIAVVDMEKISTGNIDNPFDPTGTWTFTCISPPNDPVYSCPDEPFPSAFLHRISGTMPDGSKIYGLGVWPSEQHFNRCGKIEGVGNCDYPTTCTTAIKDGDTVTLDQPDARFHYDNDSVWQTLTVPNTKSTCNSSAQYCTEVTNSPCEVQGCWGWCMDTPMCTNFQPFTDLECKQLCFAEAYWSHEVRENPNYCIQRREYDHSKPPSDPNFIVLMEGPSSRFAFGQLVYINNSTASFVNREDGVSTIWDQVNKKQYTCWLSYVTSVTIVKVTDNELNLTVNQTTTLSSGSPPQCADPSISNNYVAERLSQNEHMLFRMTR